MQVKLIKFLSPKKLELFGFYLGKKKPTTIYIFVHGLGGSIFRKTELYRYLTGRTEGVLAFNNRGSEIISKFYRVLKNRYQTKIIGTAHEVFADCRDDLTGAVLWAKQQKTKKIILVGHSTGCQKIGYYLAGRPDKLVKGAVFLAPISDLAGVFKLVEKNQFKQASSLAKKLIKENKANQLLPLSVWPDYIDAQRFLSLYSSDSLEEVFPYSQSDQAAKTLARVKVPIYFLLGNQDKFLDRAPEEIIDWLLKKHKHKNNQGEIIKGAGHSFRDYEKKVARKVKDWLEKL